MTTNYVNRLDSALIRPGRVDMAKFIADATPHQVDDLCMLCGYLVVSDLVRFCAPCRSANYFRSSIQLQIPT